MRDKTALKKSIEGLRSSLWDGPRLLICRNYRPSGDCDNCPCYEGNMSGACCAGLLIAANTHLTMFHRGGCDFKAANKRMLTLADYLERVLEKL